MHLSDMGDFCKAFANFQNHLALNGITLDEKNTCGLFDIWLSNHKDERFLNEQFKKEPWETD